MRLKTGAVADDSVLLLIPMPQPIAPGKEDYVVRGVVDMEVSGAEGHTLRDLQRQYDVKAVISVDTLDFGSKDMWHWEVALK